MRWCASPIAQLVERAAVNLKVAGSNPAGRDPLRRASSRHCSRISLAWGSSLPQSIHTLLYHLPSRTRLLVASATRARWSGRWPPRSVFSMVSVLSCSAFFCRAKPSSSSAHAMSKSHFHTHEHKFTRVDDEADWVSDVIVGAGRSQAEAEV